MTYEWDPVKAATNVRKHGIRFEDALTAFTDPFAVVWFDAWHSVDEIREVLLGLSDRGVLIVVFTERQPSAVRRIISARKASRKERRQYEKGVDHEEGI